ncbi:hypothetical protein BH10BAC1_BH10BAC1_19510 [soil metagenome]
MDNMELKLSLHKLIDSIEDVDVLNSLYEFLKKASDLQADFWDELTDEQKVEIKKSIAEADRGELISHEEVMKEIKLKYNI